MKKIPITRGFNLNDVVGYVCFDDKFRIPKRPAFVLAQGVEVIKKTKDGKIKEANITHFGIVPDINFITLTEYEKNN